MKYEAALIILIFRVFEFCCEILKNFFLIFEKLTDCSDNHTFVIKESRDREKILINVKDERVFIKTFSSIILIKRESFNDDRKI